MRILATVLAAGLLVAAWYAKSAASRLARIQEESVAAALQHQKEMEEGRLRSRDLEQQLDGLESALQQSEALVHEFRSRGNVLYTVRATIELDCAAADPGGARRELESTRVGTLLRLGLRNGTVIRLAGPELDRVEFTERVGIFRLRFVYEPEFPTGLIGKQIDYLENANRLIVNYARIVESLGLAVMGPNLASLRLDVNGLEVINARNLKATSGRLEVGEAEFDISNLFGTLRSRYSEQLVKSAEFRSRAGPLAVWNLTAPEVDLGGDNAAPRQETGSVSPVTGSERPVEGETLPGPPMGTLYLYVDPPAAQVFLDDRLLGIARDLAKGAQLRAGRYRLRAALVGYASETRDIEVVEGQTQVRMALAPDPQWQSPFTIERELDFSRVEVNIVYAPSRGGDARRLSDKLRARGASTRFKRVADPDAMSMSGIWAIPAMRGYAEEIVSMFSQVESLEIQPSSKPNAQLEIRLAER